MGCFYRRVPGVGFSLGLGVVVGSVIGDYVPLIWVKRVAACAFIVIGILMLANKL